MRKSKEKKKKKEYRFRIEAPKEKILNKLKEEGFYFKTIEGCSTKIEICKKIKKGRIHGSIEFSPWRRNLAYIKMHEDESFNLVNQKHRIRYPSEEVEKIIKKLKNLI